MFTGQVDVVSNQATWRSKTYELVDEDDGTTTDLSEVDADIVVTIRRLDDCASVTPLATASTDNAKVTVPGPGFYWQFEDTDLTNLCPGTYRLGVKVTIDGFVTDVIDGTLAIIEGN